MEENEDLAILMRGLRGQNLSDSQFADDSIQLKLVEVRVKYLIWMICNCNFVTSVRNVYRF